MQNNKGRLIESMTVTEIFGMHELVVDLTEDDQFKIIHGVNGVGKTKFLEIIKAMVDFDAEKLSYLPFGSAAIKYSDGARLYVTRKVLEPGVLSTCKLKCYYEDGSTTKEIYSYEGPEFYQFLKRHYERTDDDLWIRKQRIGRRQIEPMYFEDIKDIYEVRRGNEYEDSASKYVNTDEETQRLINLLKETPVYLIETQRLLSANKDREEDDINRRKYGYRPGDYVEQRLRILQQSQSIRKYIQAAKSKHSSIAQKLDSTFASRLFKNVKVNGNSETLEIEEIKEKLEAQAELRNRIGEIDPIGETQNFEAVPFDKYFPENNHDAWEPIFLSTYIEDAEKKLEPLSELVEKIDVFEMTVNRRLRGKNIKVSSDKGIVVQLDSDNSYYQANGFEDTYIPLSWLSSGEQHEIILIFDLLFEVPQRAVVLIDEPEISLHVEWQMSFISDVLEIAKLNRFKFVVSTHSPQIVDRHFKKTIRMK